MAYLLSRLNGTSAVRLLSPTHCTRPIQWAPRVLLSDAHNRLQTSEPDLRPFKEIPKTKCFLGVNWEFMKDSKKLVEYVSKQVEQYGTIFRDKPFPGFPELLYVVDPTDIEKVFRVGDKGYPKRLPIKFWYHIRDELKLPYGLFFE